MNWRKVLLKIQEDRRCALEEYESFLRKSIDFTGKDVGIEIQRDVMYQTASGAAKSAGIHSFIGTPITPIERLIDKRRSLQILELPFQTDTKSINSMLFRSCPQGKPCKLRYPEEWAEKYLKNFKTRSSDDKQWKETHILDLIYRLLPIVVKEYELDGDEIKIKSTAKAEVQDFVSDKIKADFFYAIDRVTKAENSKKTYRSQASNLIKFLLFKDLEENSLIKSGEVNWAIKAGLDAKTLARYFEYLEYRCLKRPSKEAYQDLISIKLLFYAPAIFKQLDQVRLKHINQSKLTVELEEVCFAVPSTFIALANTIFSKDEPLLHMNVKKLNRFIEQTSVANKMKKITPTAIRQALRLICYQETFMIENLPRR